jgi:vacuolar-type H+-ATPase subunit I/STV1
MSLELFDRIVRYASLFGIGMIIFFMLDKYFTVDEPLDSTTKFELELYSLGKKIDSVNTEIKTLNVQADKISNQVNVTLTNVKQIKKQRDEKIHYVSNLSDSASFVFFTGWISQDFSAGR